MKMRQKDIAGFVECNRRRVWQNAEVCKQPPVLVKFLHTIIKVVGYEYLIRRIDGERNRKIKLARLFSFVSPLLQKPDTPTSAFVGVWEMPKVGSIITNNPAFVTRSDATQVEVDPKNWTVD